MASIQDYRPPPLTRVDMARPQTAPANYPVMNPVFHGLDLACRLDREADAELHLGRYSRAEQLSQQAAELRGLA